MGSGEHRRCAFAFDVSESGTRWGFRIEPDGDGSRVTEWREHGRGAWYAQALAGSGLLGRDPGADDGRRDAPDLERMRLQLEQAAR